MRLKHKKGWDQKLMKSQIETSLKNFGLKTDLILSSSFADEMKQQQLKKRRALLIGLAMARIMCFSLVK